MNSPDSPPALSPSGFRYIAFVLVSSRFERNEGVVLEQNRQFQVHINRSFGHDTVESQHRLAVRVDVRVDWGEGAPFEMEICGVGQFEYSASESIAGVERIGNFQAPALVYTQLRPIARLIAAEGGFAQFLLPTVNFAELKPSETPSTPMAQPSQSE